MKQADLPATAAHTACKRRELQASILFFLFFACLGSLYVVGFTVTETLFLTRHTQADLVRALPWLYIANALILALATWAYRYWVKRVDVARIIVINAVLGCIALGMFRQALDLPQGSAFYFALMLYFTVFYDFSATSFYAYLGNFFEMHQARRLYALICSGTAVANLASGHFVAYALRHVALPDLLYACMSIALASAMLAWLISSRCPRKPSANEESTHETRDATRAGGRLTSRYLALLALAIASSVFFIITLNYQLLTTASAQFDEAGLAAFLARFYGYAGLALFASQALLSGWMVRSLGVLSSALAYPALMLIGVFAMLFHGEPSLALVAPVFFLAMILDETLWVVIREMLYLPLPNRLRLVSQAIGYGQLGSIGKLLAGLGLLALAGVEAPHAAYVAVLLAAVLVWIAALLLLSRHYREIMLATLDAQRPFATPKSCPRSSVAPEHADEPASIAVPRLAAALEQAAPGIPTCRLLVALGRMDDEAARAVLASTLSASDGIDRMTAAQALRDSLGGRRLPPGQAVLVKDGCVRTMHDAARLARAWQSGMDNRSACLSEGLHVYQRTLLLALGLCYDAPALTHIGPREFDDHHRLHNLVEVVDAVLPRRWRRPLRALLLTDAAAGAVTALSAASEEALRRELREIDPVVRAIFASADDDARYGQQGRLLRALKGSAVFRNVPVHVLFELQAGMQLQQIACNTRVAPIPGERPVVTLLLRGELVLAASAFRDTGARILPGDSTTDDSWAGALAVEEVELMRADLAWISAQAEVFPALEDALPQLKASGVKEVMP